jgi:TatD DNase family protein
VPAARAIGEIGLDYHYDFAPPDLQRQVFRAQLRLALDLDLPVVIHMREAVTDTLEIVRTEGRGQLRGIFHCFSEGAELARRVVGLGFHVSFAGIVTFPRADKVQEAAAAVPVDRLLIETDCPYLAPVPRRGRRNEPAWLVHVADCVARLRQASRDDVERSTERAFRDLLVP